MRALKNTYQIPTFIYVLWVTVLAAIIIGVYEQAWTSVFVCLLTLGLSIYVVYLANRLWLRLPSALLTWLIVFIYATLFLGEVNDFYDRFWWWDAVMHFGSALAFGIIGFLLLFFVFFQNKVRLHPGVTAVFGFVFAVAIGAIWEIFEFALDQQFGLNMQKSGLADTMGDLMMDCLGAAAAASIGYFYITQETAGKWLAEETK